MPENLKNRRPTGWHQTEDTKAKISAKAKQRWSDPEWLLKLAAKRMAEIGGVRP